MNRYKEGWVDSRGVFGSAPIKAEGQLVEYDGMYEAEEVAQDCREYEVEFDAPDAEEVSHEST